MRSRSVALELMFLLGRWRWVESWLYAFNKPLLYLRLSFRVRLDSFLVGRSILLSSSRTLGFMLSSSRTFQEWPYVRPGLFLFSLFLLRLYLFDSCFILSIIWFVRCWFFTLYGAFQLKLFMRIVNLEIMRCYWRVYSIYWLRLIKWVSLCLGLSIVHRSVPWAEITDSTISSFNAIKQFCFLVDLFCLLFDLTHSLGRRFTDIPVVAISVIKCF